MAEYTALAPLLTQRCRHSQGTFQQYETTHELSAIRLRNVPANRRVVLRMSVEPDSHGVYGAQLSWARFGQNAGGSRDTHPAIEYLGRVVWDFIRDRDDQRQSQ